MTSVLHFEDRLEAMPWETVAAWLRGTYWAPERDAQTQAKIGARCLNLLAMEGPTPVAYLRVVHDGFTHAWLADVVVAPERRGEGLGRALVQQAMVHPELAALKVWRLATRDASGFYQSLGFAPPAHPDHLWERRLPS